MGPATYISVIGLGILYTFVTWMLVVAYGKAGIIRGINAQVGRRGRVGLLPATDRAIGLDLGSEGPSRGRSSSRS